MDDIKALMQSIVTKSAALRVLSGMQSPASKRASEDKLAGVVDGLVAIGHLTAGQAQHAMTKLAADQGLLADTCCRLTDLVSQQRNEIKALQAEAQKKQSSYEAPKPVRPSSKSASASGANSESVSELRNQFAQFAR